jgi:hypothetical protein
MKHNFNERGIEGLFSVCLRFRRYGFNSAERTLIYSTICKSFEGTARIAKVTQHV